MPEITPEVTEEIEAILKRRILEESWDDVIRIKKQDSKDYTPRGRSLCCTMVVVVVSCVLGRISMFLLLLPRDLHAMVRGQYALFTCLTHVFLSLSLSLSLLCYGTVVS
jgi:Mpp10 protein